ncbi:hypothetical protein F942_02182 [Acinetobacter ursingii ANC 3649]|uniref:OsmC-like protein n=2 Tax=Acinetobacter TaxID=469 RepID=N9C1K0_9GAMM|nr:hypothetical protein F942_02182 [Acinetobacter ursingii ANC 3649]
MLLSLPANIQNNNKLDMIYAKDTTLLINLGYYMSYTAQAQSTKTPYRVTLTDPSGHVWYVDEPEEKGGQNSAPNPILLLLSALGACTTVTLQMYADHKQIQLEHVQVDLILNPQGESVSSDSNQIERNIKLTGNFIEDQHKRLLKVAESCPVHKLLTSNISIQTEMTF